jgi:hypothetical protein
MDLILLVAQLDKLSWVLLDFCLLLIAPSEHEDHE